MSLCRLRNYSARRSAHDRTPIAPGRPRGVTPRVLNGRDVTVTPAPRRPRRRRVDLGEITMAELAEVTERMAVVRQALEVVTPGPDQAAVVVRRLRPLLADLRAVIRRLDAVNAPPAPGTPSCARCGRALAEDGRTRSWCSHACRQRAYEARRDATAQPSQ